MQVLAERVTFHPATLSEQEMMTRFVNARFHYKVAPVAAGR
jgi:hypothetical protein